MKKNYIYLKLYIDLVIAIILILLFAIPALIIAIVIKIESPGPVLFKQIRTGYKGTEFKLYKFRSMTKDNDVLDFSKSDKVTKVGHFLRKTSLDEIPQLINVIKGEMSFIGPRPWIVEYAKNFDERQFCRLNVLPGITGLAQCSGRNLISIFDKINLDLEYVENFSAKQDIKVIYLTVKTVLSKEGVDIAKSGINKELIDLKKNKEKGTNQ